MKNLLAPRYFVFIFFLSFLLLGLNIYKDYGVHWDEYNNQNLGHNWRVYILDVLHNHSIANTPLPKTEPYPMDLVHGSIIEVSLGFIKNFLKLEDLREILFLRHLCCFLIFLIGVFFFYLLCNKFFKNWKVALLGCLFLILSPRVFAHSFYDTFDISFLSFYILSLYTLILWFEQKTFLNAGLHALACAILVDIRLIGLTMVLLTCSFYLIDVFKKDKTAPLRQLFFYICVLILGIFMFWPILWHNPLSSFIKIWHETLNHSFPFSFLYLGQFYLGPDLPWHYAPVWILITTPLLYCFLFLIGCYVAIQTLSNTGPFHQKKNMALIVLSFLLPLILTQGKICNGWRHIFFIYPSFLILSLVGLLALWKILKNKFQGIIRFWLLSFTVLAISLDLSYTTYVMVSLHPFESIYFNRLAGKDMQQIKSRFELDFWGLAYRQALEYLLTTDSDKIITIATIDRWPLIRNNLNILNPADKQRFLEVPLSEAKYFLTNYLQHPGEYPLPKYASIKIGNAEILGIYKLK